MRDIARAIFDEVIGFIDLDPLESSLVSHPLVTRLAHVRQLGLAENVFPGANHTRLSHSLGTMHYAGRLANQIVEACTDDPQFAEKVRAAALLHDIGHPPLSHVLERMFEDTYAQQSAAWVFGDEGYANELRNHPAVGAIRRLDPTGNPFNNSVVSAFLIQHSPLSKLLATNDLDSLEVAQMVAGRHPRECYNQVLDGGLDADKLDYLQRDRHATGVAFGTIDTEQILRNVGRHGDVLFVGEDAAQACQHLMLVRYLWYTQVVFNRNVNVFEEMAKRIYGALSANGLVPTPAHVLDILARIQQNEPKALTEWSEFTDHQFFSGMHTMQTKIRSGEKIDESSLPRDVLRDFISRVFERSPLRRVVRIDSVEVSHPGAQGRVTWENQHPYHDAYQNFTKWLHEERTEDLRSSRVIVTHGETYLVKPIEAERPIYVKTDHDPSPSPLQTHYYSMILPMTIGSVTRFAFNRVYCVDDLLDDLKRR